jgi:hypothetical protein
MAANLDVWMPIALSSVSNKRLIDCFTGYRYVMFRRTADVPPMRDFEPSDELPVGLVH